MPDQTNPPLTPDPSGTPTPSPSPTPIVIPSPLVASWQPGSTTPIVFDRLTLTPAPNSFAGPTTLTLKVQQTPPPIPANLTLPYAFSVSAQAADGGAISSLNAPVQFTLTFADLTPYQCGNTYVNLYYFDKATNQWSIIVPAQIDMVGQSISASVSHFT